jgi:hypothetical protein
LKQSVMQRFQGRGIPHFADFVRNDVIIGSGGWEKHQ